MRTARMISDNMNAQ